MRPVNPLIVGIIGIAFDAADADEPTGEGNIAGLLLRPTILMTSAM